MDRLFVKTFGGHTRVRCLAVVIHKNRFLLINHTGLNPENSYWMPPGGGVEQNEPLAACLARELKEETGLLMTSSSFLKLYEFTNEFLHAIELFFKVEVEDTVTNLGFDPELEPSKQLITELKWMTKTEILSLSDNIIHPVVKEMTRLI